MQALPSAGPEHQEGGMFGSMLVPETLLKTPSSGLRLWA